MTFEETKKKLEEKYKVTPVFDGTYFLVEGKKYTVEGLRVIAENIPVLFNGCNIQITE